MKEQAYVSDPLNEQASVLVDAQTDIKSAVKRSVLSGETAIQTKTVVFRLCVLLIRFIRRLRKILKGYLRKK